jgi:hypothetical protein
MHNFSESGAVWGPTPYGSVGGATTVHTPEEWDALKARLEIAFDVYGNRGERQLTVFTVCANVHDRAEVMISLARITEAANRE